MYLFDRLHLSEHDIDLRIVQLKQNAGGSLIVTAAGNFRNDHFQFIDILKCIPLLDHIPYLAGSSRYEPVPAGLFTHYLKHDVTHTVPGITLNKCEILPRTDRDPSVHKGDRDKR